MRSSEPSQQGPEGAGERRRPVPPEPTVLFSGDVADAGLLRPPPSRTRLVLSLSVLVGLLVVALYGVWVEVTSEDWHAVPYALVFAVLFGLILAHGVLLYRAPRRRRGRPRTEKIGGLACTVLPNAAGLFAMVSGVAACLAALPAIAAYDYFRTGASGAGVVFAVVAAGFGCPRLWCWT